MTEKKKKLPAFTTPPVTFKFPKLLEPDFKFKKEGEFSVKAIASRAVIQPLIDQLQPHYEDAIKEGEKKMAEMDKVTLKKLEAKGTKFTSNPFFSPVYDEDGDETDEVEMKFGMTYQGEYKKGPKAGQKFTRKPGVFDAKGVPLRSSTQIWGGTTGKVSFEVSPYWVAGQLAAGISLRLQAAQIIDLVSGGQRNASSYGFGKEEGYEQGEEEADTSSDDTSSDSSGADDF